MMRRVGIVVAWLVATIVAIGIAATAVGSVRGQVTDVPAIPPAGTAALLATTTTTTPDSTTTISVPTKPETTTTISTTPPATVETTTTTTTQAPSTTTTTAAPSTTTTTPAQPMVKTYQLAGGQVTISALEPGVNLVGAVPAAGFAAEIEDSGPEQVRVEFESDDHKSSFRAEWEDGELDVDLKEEPEGDD